MTRDLDPVELDQLLYDDEPDYSEPPGDIPSDGSGVANWHMRHVVAIEAQAQVDDERFKAAIAELTARRKGVAARHDANADWHKGPLEAWHRRERGAGRLDGKKLSLPGGSAQLRASKKVERTDDDQLRAWLEQQTDDDGRSWAASVFRQTEDFMVSELTKRVQVPNKKGGREPGSVADLVDPETGEKVPGVRVVILPDTWSVSGS